MIGNELKRLTGLSPSEAVKLQKELADSLLFQDTLANIKTVAGADVSYSKATNKMYAGFVVMSYPCLSVLEQSAVSLEAKFPYIPGLLSFREGESLVNAFHKLKIIPDVIVFDGQGIAHPRGLGIASHIGLLLDIPSIGVGKSLLVGAFTVPPIEKGGYSPLNYKNKVIGAVLRTKKNCNPLFVSQGYKVGFEESINLILNLCRQFKLPEPVRAAHNFVNTIRKQTEQI